MKKILGASVLLLSMPLVASADVTFSAGFPFSDVDSFVSGIVRNVSSATASSSGNTDAAVSVRTRVNSNGGQTTYETEVITETDGSVKREVSSGTVQNERVLNINIATTSRGLSGRSEARGRVQLFVGRSATTTKPALTFPTWFSSDKFAGGKIWGQIGTSSSGTNQRFQSLFERMRSFWFSR